MNQPVPPRHADSKLMVFTQCAALALALGANGPAVADDAAGSDAFDAQSLRVLAEALERQAKAENDLPRSPPAMAGNLHEDDVVLPSDPAQLLTYIATFEERVSRLEGVLSRVCSVLTDQPGVEPKVTEICRTVQGET